MKNQDIENINSIRSLAIDMTEKAKIDLPYFTYDLTPIMYNMFKNHIKFNPNKPSWLNRDRFVYGEINNSSPLLYSVLHHFGYNISMEELKNFYKQDSQTPFFPSTNKTVGVEVSACPSGQELAQAVGLALAEKKLSQHFKQGNIKPIHHYTYVIISPESLHEGISYEAMSLASSLKLKKLIIINANSLITNSSDYKSVFCEDIKTRCHSQGFEYIEVNGSNNLKDFEKAIALAKKSTKPSFIDVKVKNDNEIKCKGKNAVCYHAMYQQDELETLKKGCNHSGNIFAISDVVKKSFQKIINSKKMMYQNWKDNCEVFIKQDKNFQKSLKKEYKIDLLKHFDTKKGKSFILLPNHKGYFSNKSSVSLSKPLKLYEKLWKLFPFFVGGIIHLWDKEIFKNSNMDYDLWKKKNTIYGIREFAMASATNGLTLHSGIKASCNIPMIYLDYTLPAIKMAAIEQVPSLFVITNSNSSIKYGSFTQVLEQLSYLRAIPDINVFYPCDAHETLISYNMYFRQKSKPTVIIMQSKPVNTISGVSENDFKKGAYIIKKEKDKNNFKTIIASGLDVHIALEIAKNRNDLRVVSMPSINIFRAQDSKIQKSIVPNREKTLFIEISNDAGAYQFAKKVYGIRRNAYSNWNETLDIIDKNKQFVKVNKILKEL